MAKVIRAADAPLPAERQGTSGGAPAAEEGRALACELVRAAQAEAERIGAAAREEARHHLTLAEEARAAAEAARARALEALEVDVAGLALAVAAKLLGRAAEADEGLVREMARRALSRLPAASEVVIRVSPEDADSLRSGLTSLSAGAPHAGRLAVRPDAAVGRGGAVAESATASADARLEAQLDAVARALRGER
jgi:flagellar biosynthesis/type III secretory pathway protein FliH